jgi:hypothetical protein
VLIRADLLNLEKDGKSCNVPFYAAALLDRFV